MHGLIRECMDSEFSRLTHANDALYSSLAQYAGSELRDARKKRASDRAGKELIMTQAMNRSRSVLKEVAQRLEPISRAHSGDDRAVTSGGSDDDSIPQLDGSDSPPNKKRQKYSESRSRDRDGDKSKSSRGRKKSDEPVGWKPKSKMKEAYDPLRGDDPKFPRYVDMVVDAVREDFDVKEYPDDPPFDAVEILKVGA